MQPGTVADIWESCRRSLVLFFRLGDAVKNISDCGVWEHFEGRPGNRMLPGGCSLPGTFGRSVELSYLGENLHYAGPYICDMDFAVIVGGLCMGGCIGNIHCWDKRTFQHNTSWLVEKSDSMRLLAQALARLELCMLFPEDILFLWIEPGLTDGFGMSSGMRKALRKTVHIIKENLFRRGFLPETAYRLSSIYQLEVLGTTA